MDNFLKPGDVIQLKEGHKVYAHLPRHFLYSNYRGDWTMGNDDVVIGGELLCLAGTYIVTETKLEGGGDPSDLDTYPDGHHVYCTKIIHGHDGTVQKLDFYQSGHFTAMIPEIETISLLDLQITEKPDAPMTTGL